MDLNYKCLEKKLLLYAIVIFFLGIEKRKYNKNDRYK